MRYLFLLLIAALGLTGCAQPSQATVRVFVPTQTPPIATIPPTRPSAQAAAPSSTAASNLPLIVTATQLPATPTPEQPWRFVVLGDTRTAGLDPPAITGQIVGLARGHTPELTLVTGDLINAMDDQASVREQWLRWRTTLAPLGETAGGSPWLLVTPGNHDVQGHTWATDLMVEAFPELPANGPSGLDRLAYYVDYRGIRFISVHSEIYGDGHHLGADQYAWLEGLLQNNPNRYTFVFSHDPVYPVGPHIGSALDVYPQERDQLWALFKQYHVTAYIAGHEHLYNRQSIDGVTQLVIGTSGSYVYPGFGGEFYHYLVAEVRSDRIELVVYDDHNAERDRFTLPN